MSNSVRFPNLFMETYCGNHGHHSTYAHHANVTPGLLDAIIMGQQKITISEVLGIVHLTGYPLEYLFNEKLFEYNLSNPKHYREVCFIYRQFEEAKKASKAEWNWRLPKKTPTWEKTVKFGCISRAEINSLLIYIQHVHDCIEHQASPPRDISSNAPIVDFSSLEVTI